MSFDAPGETNPFAAPRSKIGATLPYLEGVDGNAEAIRRAHLGREGNIKSIGALYYLSALLFVLFSIGSVMMAAGLIPTPANQGPGMDPAMQKIIMGASALFYLILTALNGSIGYGLTHLQVWARWTAVVLTSLGLLGVAFYSVVISLLFGVSRGLGFFFIFGGFSGLILWLLVSAKAGMVFSGEYKEIIRQTPYVKMKTSIIVKILLGILIAVLLIGLLGGLVGYLMR